MLRSKYMVGFLVFGLLMPVTLPSQPEAPAIRITQVDSSLFPKIRVHVQVTDASGAPLADTSRIILDLLEDGNWVQSTPLSQGSPVSSVLVLDHSGSMAGEKIQKAKSAALSYVAMAPDSYQLAIVGFSSQVEVSSAFTSNKEQLRAAIGGLSAGGTTALQDAIDSALRLLAERPGRRAILVLTDGIENASHNYPGYQGYVQLLQDAKTIGATISTIGLGGDVRAGYLGRFEATGGLYFFAPDPDELKAIFAKSATLLATEQELEFESSHRADGRVGNLTARIAVTDPAGTQQIAESNHKYVVPEFIPNIRGRLAPYFAGLMVLLLAPGLFSMVTAGSGVRTFRSSQLRWLPPRSRFIGMSDPNAGPSRPFVPGDPVIVCPSCARPHHVRSWRNNLCNCMYESVGKGYVCFHRAYPAWVRRFLDSLSGCRTTVTGRTWLCRCAGDEEGY